MDAFPPPVSHHAPVMYGVSYGSANPSSGASYRSYAPPMHYSYLYAHQAGRYPPPPPPDPIGGYHDVDYDPYYDDDEGESGCSIM